MTPNTIPPKFICIPLVYLYISSLVTYDCFLTKSDHVPRRNQSPESI